jgi:hypothetical protein
MCSHFFFQIVVLFVVRHIACDVLALVIASDEGDYDNILTAAKFFARTGKLWAGNFL